MVASCFRIGNLHCYLILGIRRVRMSRALDNIPHLALAPKSLAGRGVSFLFLLSAGVYRADVAYRGHRGHGSRGRSPLRNNVRRRVIVGGGGVVSLSPCLSLSRSNLATFLASTLIFLGRLYRRLSEVTVVHTSLSGESG